jgi:hypothetical protein
MENAIAADIRAFDSTFPRWVPFVVITDLWERSMEELLPQPEYTSETRWMRVVKSKDMRRLPKLLWLMERLTDMSSQQGAIPAGKSSHVHDARDISHSTSQREKQEASPPKVAVVGAGAGADEVPLRREKAPDDWAYKIDLSLGQYSDTDSKYNNHYREKQPEKQSSSPRIAVVSDEDIEKYGEKALSVGEWNIYSFTADHSLEAPPLDAEELMHAPINNIPKPRFKSPDNSQRWEELLRQNQRRTMERVIARQERLNAGEEVPRDRGLEGMFEDEHISINLSDHADVDVHVDVNVHEGRHDGQPELSSLSRMDRAELEPYHGGNSNSNAESPRLETSDFLAALSQSMSEREKTVSLARNPKKPKTPHHLSSTALTNIRQRPSLGTWTTFPSQHANPTHSRNSAQIKSPQVSLRGVAADTVFHSQGLLPGSSSPGGEYKPSPSPSRRKGASPGGIFSAGQHSSSPPRVIQTGGVYHSPIKLELPSLLTQLEREAERRELISLGVMSPGKAQRQGESPLEKLAALQEATSSVKISRNPLTRRALTWIRQAHERNPKAIPLTLNALCEEMRRVLGPELSRTGAVALIRELKELELVEAGEEIRVSAAKAKAEAERRQGDKKKTPVYFTPDRKVDFNWARMRKSGADEKLSRVQVEMLPAKLSKPTWMKKKRPSSAGAPIGTVTLVGIEKKGAVVKKKRA